MKTLKSSPLYSMAGSLALAALAVISSPTNSRANVYATDILVNGNLTNTVASPGSSVSISYHINETDCTNVSIQILKSNSVVTTLAGGTNFGLNSVSWSTTNLGTYTFKITASATGFPFWTQISQDSYPGNFSFTRRGCAWIAIPTAPISDAC